VGARAEPVEETKTKSVAQQIKEGAERAKKEQLKKMANL